MTNDVRQVVERLRRFAERVYAQKAELWPTPERPYVVKHDRATCGDSEHIGCAYVGLVEAARQAAELLAEVVLLREQVAAYQANEHACEMKMIRGVAEAQERMTVAEGELERLRALEIMGGIAAELVGKVAEIVGARPVFASDGLSQQELLTAVQELKERAEKAEADVARMRAAFQRVADCWNGPRLPTRDQCERAAQVIRDCLTGEASPSAPSGWQQRIAAMDPYELDVFCRFCREHRRLGHLPVCLWQNAKDALPPVVEASPAKQLARDVAGLVPPRKSYQWTTRLYRCRSCGYETNVQATEHRPMMCDRTNCVGETEPVAEAHPSPAKDPKEPAHDN